MTHYDVILRYSVEADSPQQARDYALRRLHPTENAAKPDGPAVYFVGVDRVAPSED